MGRKDQDRQERLRRLAGVSERVLGRLEDVPLARETGDSEFYAVDTTIVRVRTSQVRYYTGYKHIRGVKTQVLADDRKVIHHLSATYPASVHDKLIWDQSLRQVQPFLDRPVLGDKADDGAKWKAKG